MTLVRVSASPSITAGTFDVADAVGGQIQFNTSADAGAVVGCRVLDKGRQSVPLELWLFRASTTGSGLGNNEAFAPSDGQIANLAAVVRISNWFAAAANSIGQSANLPLSFADLSGGLLYGWLVCRGTPTYAAGDLTVELELEQGATPLARRRLYYRKRRYPPLTTLTITQAENFHTIHLKFVCSQPANLPPSTVKITGSYLLNGRWIDFHPALPNPQDGQTLYTVLFGLQEDKTYPVKVEFTRTNNATGALIERRTYHYIFKTRKSPTYDTAISGSTCRFVDPSGNDTNEGSQSLPCKTIPGAIAKLNYGSVTRHIIVLEDGTYYDAAWDFDTETGTTISGLDGTENQYKVIRARNAGMAVISGGRPMPYARKITAVSVSAGVSYTLTSANHGFFAGLKVNITGITGTGNLPTDLNANQLDIASVTSNTFTINDTTAGGTYTSGGTATPANIWTREQANVFTSPLSWHVEPDYATSRATGLIRNVTGGSGGVAGNILPMYGSVSSLIAAEGHGGEGFCMDWHNSKIWLRTVTDVTPSDGQYLAAGPNFWALLFDQCDYVILDGLKFDMFAIAQRDSATRAITNVSVSTGVSYTLTSTKHGLFAGLKVNITGIIGTGNLPTDLNANQLQIASVTIDTFTILDSSAGGTYTSGGTATPTDKSGHENRQALTLQRCTDFVIRNCTLMCAGIHLGSFYAGMERITIEDSTIEDYDPWGKQTHAFPYFDAGLWEVWDLDWFVNTRSMIWATGCRKQLVVRRCSIRKGFVAINMVFNVTADPNLDMTDCDFYENAFERIFDDTFEWDWEDEVAKGGGAGSCINHAAWHNTFDSVLGCFSASPLPKGPIWLIANRAKDYAFWFIRKGSDDADNTKGAAWLLDYNNTRHSSLINRDTFDLDPDDPAPGWATNRGQTNARHVNCILSHPDTGHTKYQPAPTFSFPGTGNPDVLFETCAFYSSDTDPEWYWENGGTTYQLWQDMDTGEPDAELRMIGVIDCNKQGFNPLPNGVTGAVHSNVVGIATQIAGVTSIAADASGNALTEPLNLGYFPKWQN